MLELLLPFVIYLAAKSLHIGAVIAVVASGLMLSLLPQRHTAATARTKLQAQSVWTTLEFVLNGIIFVVLGMQLPRLLEPAAEGSLGDPATLLGVVVVLTLVLEGVRFLWLLAMDVRAAIARGDGVRSCFAREALRGTLAMALAGAKGGITLSLMLTLTAAAGLSASGQATLVSIASGMIVLTLVLADFAVPALTPSKRSAKRTRDRVDAEIDLTLGVIASIEADAHLTGAVKDAAVDAVDEPATVIVMHRYADMLEDLAPAASPAAAARARAEVARVRGLYDQLDGIARRAARWDEGEDDMEGEESPAAPSLSDQFHQMRETHDAVEDVQAQALVRELQLIKAMVADDSIDAAHAKDLRNDVYIQQLVLD